MVFSGIDLTGLDSIELILQQPIKTLYFKYLVFGLTTNHGNLASLTLGEPQFWYEQIIGIFQRIFKRTETKLNDEMLSFLLRFFKAWQHNDDVNTGDWLVISSHGKSGKMQKPLFCYHNFVGLLGDKSLKNEFSELFLLIGSSV